jgi:Zn-finger nucleic acid-binding protein
MEHCPDCGLMLEPATAAGLAVVGCAECGGLWLAADDLQALLRHHPERLDELERLFSGDGAAPRPAAPPCPQCGAALTGHGVADLELLECRACRGVWLRDGQAAELGAALGLRSAAPAADQAPVGRPRFRWRWDDRGEGQSRLSWLVYGMPLWFALALVLGAWAVTDSALVVLWPLVALGLQLVLKWVCSDDDAVTEDTGREIYAGLLRVTAALLLACPLLFFSLEPISDGLAMGVVLVLLVAVAVPLAGVDVLDTLKDLGVWIYRS